MAEWHQLAQLGSSLGDDGSNALIYKTRIKSIILRFQGAIQFVTKNVIGSGIVVRFYETTQRLKVFVKVLSNAQQFHSIWIRGDDTEKFLHFHAELNQLLTEMGSPYSYVEEQYQSELEQDNEHIRKEVTDFLRAESTMKPDISGAVGLVEQLRGYPVLPTTIPPINTVNTSLLQASNDSLRIQGIGRFGACYSGTLRGVPVMIKRVSPANYSTKEGAIKEQDELRKEALILQYVNLPGVIRLFGVDDGLNPSYIVMEEVVCTLSQVLHGKDKKGRVDVNYKLTVLWELCDALKHLESFGIVHRDIRPENVYITRYRAKLANFGFTKHAEHGTTMGEAAKGTYAYMSPELLTYTDGPYVYSRATDMYAFGIMMNEVLTEVIPFQININLLIRRMFTSPNETRPALYEDESNAVQCAELQGIIRRCWDIETERPTFAVTVVEIKHLLVVSNRDADLTNEEWSRQVHGSINFDLGEFNADGLEPH